MRESGGWPRGGALGRAEASLDPPGPGWYAPVPMRRELPIIATVAVASALLLAACDRSGSASEAPSRNEGASESPSGAGGSQVAEGPASGAPAAGVPTGVGSGEGAEGAAPAGGSAASVPTSGRVTAFDLATNQLLAHLHSGGALVVPMGSPSAARYTQGQWKSAWFLGERVDGEPVAMTDGVQGMLRVPLDAASCASGCKLRIRLHPYGEAQRVDVFVNDTRMPTLSLETGMRTYELAVPAGAVTDGENRIRLHFRRSVAVGTRRSAAAVAWLTLGGPGGADPPPASAVLSTDGALDGGAFDTLEWYTVLPRDGAFEVTPRGSDGATFHVSVRADGAAPVAVEGPADGKPRVVDLAGLAGEGVRISLQAKGSVTWQDARITVPAPRALTPPAPARNVIIWMVDTLRVDRLNSYNPKTHVKTPTMDRLAREGVRVSAVTVQGAHSIPSHASLLSGLHPDVHGHISAETKLSKDLELVSETFSSAGFQTAAFLSNGYVSTKWGFKQGWSIYKNYIRDEQPAHSGAMLKDILPWIDRHKGDRMFMYLATVDPHVAYHWRDDYAGAYDPDPYGGPVPRSISGHFLNAIQQGKVRLTDRDKKHLVATYDGEVSYNDAQLARLIAHLEELGILDDTLIVVTSDHGEEMFEHGSVGHGQSLYQELISVPLLLWRKGALPAARVVDTDAEIVDVAPTVLSLAGLAPVDAHQGADLAHQIFGQAPDLPRPAFAEKGTLARSLKIGRWKYILRGGDNDDLFDLDADPREQTDAKESKPVAHRAMRDVMGIWLAYGERWSKRRWGVPSNHTAAFVESVLGR